MGYVKSFLLFLSLIGVGFYYFIKVLFYWGDTTLNHQFLQSFTKFAFKIVGIKMKVLNGERLNLHRPAVLIANHQTGLDLATLGFMSPPNSLVIVKRELFYIPFLGLFLKGAGNLLIDRSKSRQAKDAILNVIQKLKEKKWNVVIMPEGTRNKGAPGTLLPFKRGAFNLAIEGQLPIIPSVCSSLNGIAIWEKRELKGGNVIFSVLEPIETKGLSQEDVHALADRVWNLMNEELKRINALVKNES